MEEVTSEGYQNELRTVRQRYETEVIPRQQEVLNRLQATKMEDIVGNEMYEAIEQAFSTSPTFTSDDARERARCLADNFDPMGPSDNVREVNGLIVRRNYVGPLLTTEIFDYGIEIPPALDQVIHEKFPNKNNLLHPYMHFLVSDRITKKSVDLLDLGQTKNAFLIDSRAGWSGYSSDGYILVENADELFPDFDPSNAHFRANRIFVNKVMTLLHESGHSHQSNEDGDEIIKQKHRMEKKTHPETLSAEELAEFVVEERNAWAFAVLAARRCRNLGVDITEMVDRRTVAKVLNTYDQSLGVSDEVVFNKKQRF